MPKCYQHPHSGRSPQLLNVVIPLLEINEKEIYDTQKKQYYNIDQPPVKGEGSDGGVGFNPGHNVNDYNSQTYLDVPIIISLAMFIHIY